MDLVQQHLDSLTFDAPIPLEKPSQSATKAASPLPAPLPSPPKASILQCNPTIIQTGINILQNGTRFREEMNEKMIEQVKPVLTTSTPDISPLLQLILTSPRTKSLCHKDVVISNTAAEIRWYHFAQFLSEDKMLCDEFINIFFFLLLIQSGGVQPNPFMLVKSGELFDQQRSRLMSLEAGIPLIFKPLKIASLSTHFFPKVLAPLNKPPSSSSSASSLQSSTSIHARGSGSIRYQYDYSLVRRWSGRMRYPSHTQTDMPSRYTNSSNISDIVVSRKHTDKVLGSPIPDTGIVLNNLDFLLVPCHVRSLHWTLILVDIVTHKMYYFDSMLPQWMKSDNEYCPNVHHNNSRNNNNNDTNNNNNNNNNSNDPQTITLEKGVCLLATLEHYLYDEFITKGGFDGYLVQDEDYCNVESDNTGRDGNPPDPAKSNKTWDYLGDLFDSSKLVPIKRSNLQPITPSLPPSNLSSHGHEQSKEQAASYCIPSNNCVEAIKRDRGDDHPVPQRYKPFEFFVVKGIPQQTNFYDCGIYVLLFSYYLVCFLTICHQNHYIQSLHNHLKSSGGKMPLTKQPKPLIDTITTSDNHTLSRSTTSWPQETSDEEALINDGQFQRETLNSTTFSREHVMEMRAILAFGCVDHRLPV